MRLEYYSGTEAFGNDVLDPLLRHEEQNNLLISFARNDRKAETSGWLLATVKDNAGSVLLTAACTPPFNLVLAETDNRPCPAAVKLLASELKTMRRMFPGVLAEQTLARRFAEEFAGTGRYRINHSMTVMRLDHVANHTPSPGAARPLREEDLFFVPYWCRAFAEEAHVGQPGLDASIEQTRKRIGADTFYLWEDRIPVSQACHARSTMHGAAISAVYTPPPYRRRGYASSLVAELSRVLLERGNRFCCLFADTANPVSCGIYRRIGYVDRCIVEELQWLP